MIHPSKFQKILLCSCVEIHKIWVYHWGVTAVSAESTKHPFLNILLWNQNLFNQLEIFWTPYWYVCLGRKFYLKENNRNLGKL